MSSSWLYARGTDSVLIIELGTTAVAICGPGPHRVIEEFERSDQVFTFRQQTANLLTAAGYRFIGFRTERRAGVERRRAGRRDPERRVPPPETIQ